MVLGTKYKLSLINDFGIFLDMLVSSRSCWLAAHDNWRTVYIILPLANFEWHRIITGMWGSVHGGEGAFYYQIPPAINLRDQFSRHLMFFTRCGYFRIEMGIVVFSSHSQNNNHDINHVIMLVNYQGVGFSFPRKKRYEGYSSTLLALRGGGLASNFKEKIAT